MTGTGLPHSEIPGSKRACRSPRLIAACRVLHRLLSPRHPSCALTSLTTKNPVRIRCRDTFRIASERLLRGRSFSRSYACAVVKEPSFRVFARAVPLTLPLLRRGRCFRPGRCRCPSSIVPYAVLPSYSRQGPCHLPRALKPHRTLPAWWACLESNQGPRPYQGRALTN